MRILASLGGLGFLTAACLAQTPVRTGFAADAGRLPPGPITVSVLPAAAAVPVAVAPPVAPPVVPMGYSGQQLLRMSECELVQVYKAGVPGMPPCGYTPGTIIFQPGSPLTVPTSQVLGATAWQGKYLPGDGTMVNKMFGLPSIKAEVTSGESFIDGRPSVVFDYQNTSFVWRNYRDEVREVSPGVYLGVMHWVGWCGPKVATWFALDTVHCGKGCKGGK
jgi:hypothetical protein